MFGTGVVWLMSVNHSTRSGGILGISSIFFNMKVYCVFSLESPQRGDSNEYIQYTIFNIKKENTLNYPNSILVGFFLGIEERVRNSRGKRAISVFVVVIVCLFGKRVFQSLWCFTIRTLHNKNSAKSRVSPLCTWSH